MSWWKETLKHPWLWPMVRPAIDFLDGEKSFPDFLIAGAMKAGTSSLFYYLCQHPAIAGSRVKEVHYFSNMDNYSKGPDWYRSHFCTLAYKRRKENELGHRILTGEASPSHANPYTPRRIQDLIPEVKIIFILRDPVERAYSHYRHHLRVGRIPKTLTFESAIEREFEYYHQDLELLRKAQADPDFQLPDTKRSFYLLGGYYALYLKHWMKFFPHDQFLILRSEELSDKPEIQLKQVYRFLEIPDAEVDTTQKNVNQLKPPIAASSISQLEDHFSPLNQELYEFLAWESCWNS